MKRWKFVLSAWLVAVLALFPLALSGCANEESKYPKPTEAFFVNDFANVLSPETEQIILSKGAALAEKTKAQVVVLTVQTMDDEPIEEYALNLGREWGIGDEEDNTGVLLLLAVEERETRIEVGYGLEGILPDSKAGRFLDNYAVPHFRNDDFDTGVRETYQALVNEVYLEFGLEAEADPNYVPIDQLQRQEQPLDSGSSIVAAIIALVFVLGFSGLSVFGRRRGWPIFLMMGNHHHRGGSGFGGFGGGGFRGGGGSFGGGGASRGF